MGDSLSQCSLPSSLFSRLFVYLRAPHSPESKSLVEFLEELGLELNLNTGMHHLFNPPVFSNVSPPFPVSGDLPVQKSFSGTKATDTCHGGGEAATPWHRGEKVLEFQLLLSQSSTSLPYFNYSFYALLRRCPALSIPKSVKKCSWPSL